MNVKNIILSLFYTTLIIGTVCVPYTHAQSPSPETALNTTDNLASDEADRSPKLPSDIASVKKTGLELFPAALDITITQAEQEKEESIFLVNHNTHAITLELKAINFRQKDLSGIVQFLGEKSETYTYSLASYIQLPFTEIALEPGEKKEVPIIITNRQDLSPGGHYAGIIVRQKLNAQQKANTTAILPAAASLIFLRKSGGEQFNLSIKDVDLPSHTFEFMYPKKVTLLFQNEGNVHLIPHGRVEIKDMFGRLISKGILNVSSVYVFPSSRRYISIDIQKLRYSLPVSINVIDIKGQDTLKKTTYLYKQTYIYINPVFGLGLLGLIIALIYRKKRHTFRKILKRSSK